MTKSIKEKVYGAVFGFAIGDALGLGTEFMSRSEVARRYPRKLRHYSDIIRDAHRSQWKRGEWSNDTEVICILLQSIIENGGVDCIDYAKKLKRWYESDPVDMTHNLRYVLSQKSYLDDPFATSAKVWTNMKKEATSDCLGRAVLAGIWNRTPETEAIDLCRLTHAHPRCEASSAVVAVMASSLMWQDREAPYDVLLDVAKRHNLETAEYIETARFGTLEDLRLDDENTQWYVRKAMAAALWAVWHCSDPMEALYAVIDQGGDADTNASLACSLVALRTGGDALDKALVDGLLEKQRLAQLADAFTEILEKRDAR